MDMKYISPEDGECLYCHGDGDCPRCHGHGYVGQKICPTCHGEEVCPNCHGEGYFDLPERRSSLRGTPNGLARLPHHIMHEFAQPGSGNYRGHCVAALMQSNLRTATIDQIQKQIPQHVNYEKYVEFTGIVTSGQTDRFITGQVNRLFPNWLIQFLSTILRWLQG